jgi:hypothetical protein
MSKPGSKNGRRSTMERDLLDRVAAVAHDLWRREMEQAGWEFGPAFSEARRTHDAMVPYEQLKPFDQHRLRIGIACLELDRQLLESVDHDRGPSREFQVSELKVGEPVQLTGPFGDGPVEAEGFVTGWVPGPDGSVESISVQFTDGDAVEYLPCQRELRRPVG